MADQNIDDLVRGAVFSKKQLADRKYELLPQSPECKHLAIFFDDKMVVLTEPLPRAEGASEEEQQYRIKMTMVNNYGPKKVDNTPRPPKPKTKRGEQEDSFFYID